MEILTRTLKGKTLKYTKNDKGCFTSVLKPTNSTGYIRTHFMGRNSPKQYLHRVAYEAYYGISTNGSVVMHNCDNPACFNPLHLSLGTQQDNLKDMRLKGRANDFGRNKKD